MTWLLNLMGLVILMNNQFGVNMLGVITVQGGREYDC